jgi:hypothetical protein
MKILVCGPRDWTNERKVRVVLSRATGIQDVHYTIIHGACPTGVDAFADAWAKTAGVDWALASRPSVERFPADWEKHGKAAGPMRNQAMIDSKPDVVIAFAWVASDMRILTPGTRDCVARALRAGLVVHVVPVLREPEAKP